MRPAGFEPATYCLEGSCSIQMSYDLLNSQRSLQIWYMYTIGVKKSQPIMQTYLGLQHERTKAALSSSLLLCVHLRQNPVKQCPSVDIVWRRVFAHAKTSLLLTGCQWFFTVSSFSLEKLEAHKCTRMYICERCPPWRIGAGFIYHNCSTFQFLIVRIASSNPAPMSTIFFPRPLYCAA